MSKHAQARSGLRTAAGTVALVAVTLGVIVSLVALSGRAADLRDTSADASSQAYPSLTFTPEPTATAPLTTTPGTNDKRDKKGTKKNEKKDKKKGTKLAKRVEKLAKREKPPLPATAFRVTTLNILGASHTTGKQRGNRYRAGVVRAGHVATLLNNYGVDVAGLQEVQGPQWGVLARNLPNWRSFGPALGREVMANSIIWRSDEWEFVEGYTVQIPYFGGNRRGMPYVKLRNLASGRDVWFANFHNPADAHGPAQRWRDAATRIEIGLANTLTADGTPLVFTGDFNDRERYFCPITGATTLHAANGGSTDGACAPPSRMDVDWVLGSEPITWTSFLRITEGLVRATTDHPMIVADASIPPAEETP